MNPVRALKSAYSEVKDNYDDPIWIRDRITQRVVRPIHRIYPNDTISIMDEDWDTLLVLDACRADLFEEVANLDRFDTYQRRTSAGSMTREWTQRNFASGRFGDTVYVASNPYTSTIASDSFHDLYEVWRSGFDDEERTVLPRTVAQAAKEAYDEYPNKRLIVHFMQPHYPFISHPELRYQSWRPDEITDGNHSDERPHDPWQALQMGLTDQESVWNAYADNLDRGLATALDLVNYLDGKTVVTSDHGNMLGERVWPVPIRLYGHPEGIRHPALIDVPWAVIEDDERRKITDEGVTTVGDVEEEIIENRLRDLGYA